MRAYALQERERCADYLAQQAALCPEDSVGRAMLESVSAVVSTRAQRLTRQQALALHTMLDHYGGDPRTRCLVELLPDNLRRDFGA
jgi:uncharacterized Zn finger protein